MNNSFTIPGTFHREAYKLIVLFLSLSLIARVIVFSSLVILCLFVFGLIVDAVSELSQHLAQIYTSSDSITRLIIFVLGVLFCKKCLPYALRIFRGV